MFSYGGFRHCGDVLIIIFLLIFPIRRSVDLGSGRHHTLTIVSESLHLTNDNVVPNITEILYHPPRFNATHYAFNIPENTDRGAVVATIQVSDIDTSSRLITYGIISDYTSDDIFWLNEKSGEFILMRRLDYEADSNFYIVKCEATDGTLKSSPIFVYFNLINLNDNRPIFDTALYRAEVIENAAVGLEILCVSASDADSSDKSALKYFFQISKPNDERKEYQSRVHEFKINKNTGCIYLIKSVDRETIANYELIVVADDGLFKTAVTVNIIVRDVNDNRPIFHQETPKTLKVPEDSAVNLLVYSFKANDADDVPNNYVQYELENGGRIGISQIFPFTIGPIDGQLRLSGKLDYETQDSYSLILKAKDYGGLSSEINITVDITDVNDNSPKFEENELRISVTENSSIESRLLKLKAHDLDKSDKIIYRISSGDKNGNFKIFYDDLVLAKSLDYEQTQSYLLTVQAVDNGGNFGVVLIHVNVVNVFDEAPRFPDSPYFVNWTENEIGIIGNFVAIGETEGDKQQDEQILRLFAHPHPHHLHHHPHQQESLSQNWLNYLLRNNRDQHFDLDSRNALLRVVKPVDRETVARSNAASMSATTTTTTSSSSTTTMATFPSSSSNSSGINSIIELRIIAIDKRMPQLIGEGIIYINIVDVNDNRPTFLKDKFHFVLNESYPYKAGTIIGRVEAHDEDSSDVLLYEIVESEMTTIFSINSRTGDLSFKNEIILDREKRDSYWFHVRVRDSKYEIKTTVSIQVDDVNDCRPIFRRLNGDVLKEAQLQQSSSLQSLVSSSLSVKISKQLVESLAAERFVLGVSVSDCDQPNTANSRVKFDVKTEAEYDGLFVIDSKTGIVRATRPIPESSSFKLRLSAEDMPIKDRLNNQMIIDLSITKTSFSSAKKLVQPISKIRVSESAKVNKIIHTFQMNSPFSNSDYETQISIYGGDPYENFRIEKRYLFLNKPLDFEATAYYELFIYVLTKDRTSMSSNSSYWELLKLEIIVINENDNPPKFELDFVNVSIVEEGDDSMMVTQLFATDLDLKDDPENGIGKFVYEIVPTSQTLPFKIDPKYGTLWTNGRIDRETCSHYNLKISVKDQSGLTGYCQVSVMVLDKNDNPPRFTRLFNVNITEKAPIGSLVVQVTSSDRDEGVFAKASYSFVGKSDKFMIHPDTGNVLVSGALDRETQDEYVLTVSANDGSWIVQTTLTISILDENEPPKFDMALYRFQHPINSTSTCIGSVHAVDLDKGANSVLAYSLKKNSDYFLINSKTGEISLTPESVILKRTSSSFIRQHNITVIARDHGVIPESSEVDVIINIVPTQGLASSLLKPTASAPLNFKQGITRKIMVPYNLPNDSVIYETDSNYTLKSISPLNYNHHHQPHRIIYFHDGKVRFKGQGLVKKGEEYVYKFGSSSEHSKGDELNLAITIFAPNQYAPHFLSPSPSQTIIAENEKIDTALLHIKARDRDEDPHNSQLTYGLQVIDWEINERATAYYLQVLKRALNSEKYKKVSEREKRNLFHTLEKNISQAEAVDWNDYDDEDENYLINLPLIHLLNQTYHTRGYLNPFQVDSKTGLITLKSALDYELITMYKVRIIAADNAPFNPKNASMIVNIHITDVNDNRPIFKSASPEGQLHLTTPENNPIGHIITQLTAIDYDSVRYYQITYELAPEMDYSHFSIDSKSGLLQTLISFDYEAKRKYMVKVIARNDAMISTTLIVNIHITDVNEYRPMFKTPQYIIDLGKVVPSGSVIGSLQDKVLDEDFNETVYFYLVDNCHAGLEVMPNGTIRTTETLDSSAKSRSPANLIFTVIAKNTGPINSPQDYDEAQIILNMDNAHRLVHPNLSDNECNWRQNNKADCKAIATSEQLPMILFLATIFFVVLVIVIFTVYLIFYQQKKKQINSCNTHKRKIGVKCLPHVSMLRNANTRELNHHSSLHMQIPHPPPPMKQQRPDVIESPNQIPPSAPPVPQRNHLSPTPSFIPPYSDTTEDYSIVMNLGEHYDFENASTLAPSDIDMVYRYKGLIGRDSNSNSNIQHRHAPLTRLSPSVSELTAPRILTLQDLSPAIRNQNQCPPLPTISPPPLPPPSKAKLQSLSMAPTLPARNPLNHMNNLHSQHHEDDDEEDSNSDNSGSFSCSEYGEVREINSTVTSKTSPDSL